jgi:hypothetical protein
MAVVALQRLRAGTRWRFLWEEVYGGANAYRGPFLFSSELMYFRIFSSFRSARRLESSGISNALVVRAPRAHRLKQQQLGEEHRRPSSTSGLLDSE